MGLEGHKGFGAAVGRNVVFLQVANGGIALAGSGAVLAAHGVAGHVGHAHGAQRAQHLELFVAHGIGVERNGRLHGHDAQQLQQVVLQHVAHGPGAVVEPGAAAHAHALGHGDLHALDVGAAPQGFEDGVAKAQHHQVLHGFFAQVVVDAEGLAFGEVAAHFVVDFAGRGQVVAQRFFEHDAAAGGNQPGPRQVGADGGEQAGRGGQVVHPVGAWLQGGGQGGEVAGLGGIDADVVQALQKALPGFGILGFGFGKPRHLVLDEGQKRSLIPGLAAQAVDAGGRRQVVVQVRGVERRQQLAHREVTHPAKNDQIEHVGQGGGGF